MCSWSISLLPHSLIFLGFGRPRVHLQTAPPFQHPSFALFSTNMSSWSLFSTQTHEKFIVNVALSGSARRAGVLHNLLRTDCRRCPETCPVISNGELLEQVAQLHPLLNNTFLRDSMLIIFNVHRNLEHLDKDTNFSRVKSKNTWFLPGAILDALATTIFLFFFFVDDCATFPWLRNKWMLFFFALCPFIWTGAWEFCTSVPHYHFFQQSRLGNGGYN